MQAVNDLGALLAWLHTEWSVPIAAPYAFAIAGYHRMTDGEWSVFRGVCGHQHVPQNSHWDPGDMNVQAILNAATAHVGGAPGGVASGGVVIPGTPTFPTPTTDPATQEELTMYRWTHLGTVYVGSVATGAFWPITDGLTDPFLRGVHADGSYNRLSQVVDLGDFSQAEHDVMVASINHTRASIKGA